MKSVYLLGCLLLLCIATHAQSVKRLKGDTIVWNAADPLTREDFQGKPKGKNIAGGTVSGILLYPLEVNGEILFVAEAVFVKSKSYLTGESEYIIRHEQRHFDLAELYARQLRKKIMLTDFLKVKNIQQKVSTLYQQVSNDLMAAQEKYDRETEHGQNMARQKLWNGKIEAELKALEAYAETRMNVAK